MYQITRLLLMATLTIIIACGRAQNSVSAESGDSVTANTELLLEASEEPLLRVLQDHVTMPAFDENNNPLEVELESGDHIIVLSETVFDSSKNGLVSIVIDRNSNAPGEVYSVSPAVLLSLPVAAMSLQNDADEFSELDALDEQKMISISIAGFQKIVPVMRVARMTYCYRYVKRYLLKIGLVKVYLPGASAYQAAGILPKYGFSKVSRKPHQAITNDVCVYRGGPSGHGHIEIKTANGWYYGYGYKSAPIKNRIFTGCFHK